MAVSTIFGRFSVSQLSRNGLFSLGQAIFVTLSLLLAYRLVIRTVGLDQLGIWSLLLAGSAFARIGDISGAGALSRFVAMRAFRGSGAWVRDTVHTVLITSVVLNSVLCLALLGIAPFILARFVDPAHVSEATRLVPFAVANIFLGALAVAVTSGIDGAQRADQRSLVMVAAAMVLLVASYMLVPAMGIRGFAVAQLLYQGFILLVGWIVLRIHIPGLGWLPTHWKRRAFYETAGFAVKLNGIGIMIVLFEPLVKFGFNATGGVGSVALYELASRLVIRLRDLTTAAALPLVPAFAAHADTLAPEFRAILLKVSHLAAVAAVFNTALTLAIAPFLSLFALGRVEPDFLIIVAVLTASWNLELPVLGFYLAAKGQGILLWNFLSHATIAASVLLGVYFLAPIFGTNGILIGIIFGFATSMFPAIAGNAWALRTTSVARSTLPWAAISGGTVLLLAYIGFVLGIAFS